LEGFGERPRETEKNYPRMRKGTAEKVPGAREEIIGESFRRRKIWRKKRSNLG
jgi:hypothetical protein